MIFAIAILICIVALPVFAIYEIRYFRKQWQICQSYEINRQRDAAFWQKIDADAIRSDWDTVGKDMWKAIERFEQENGL